MPDEPNLTGREPQMSDSDRSGLEPQLGGEQRRRSGPPILLRFVAQVAGRADMVYRLEDPRSNRMLASLKKARECGETFAPRSQTVTVQGQPFQFETTGLSARLDGPQTSWHIDYVRSLSTVSRLEWALRDAEGLPLGVMRLNRPMAWLELVLADSKRLCKTTTVPHRGGIAEIIFRTDWLAPGLEPLFFIAALFGLAMGGEAAPPQGA